MASVLKTTFIQSQQRFIQSLQVALIKWAPNTPLKGAPLGYVMGPEDLIIDDDGNPLRIDKAYSWDAPLSAHGLMHMVISKCVCR